MQPPAGDAEVRKSGSGAPQVPSGSAQRPLALCLWYLAERKKIPVLNRKKLSHCFENIFHIFRQTIMSFGLACFLCDRGGLLPKNQPRRFSFSIVLVLQPALISFLLHLPGSVFARTWFISLQCALVARCTSRPLVAARAAPAVAVGHSSGRQAVRVFLLSTTHYLQRQKNTHHPFPVDPIDL